MTEIELKIWKEELQILKEKNIIRLKETRKQLDRLNIRMNFMVDIKDKLQSPMLQKIEEEMNSLWIVHENIKKEISDIEMLLFSIDIEIGNIFICN